MTEGLTGNGKDVPLTQGGQFSQQTVLNLRSSTHKSLNFRTLNVHVFT